MSELEKTVADILVKATNAAEAAGKFAVEQLPDIAQQYVMYRGVMALLSIGIAVVAVAAAVLLSLRAYKKVKSHEWPGIEFMPVGMVGGFVILVSVVEGLSAMDTAVLAFFAPKVLLIQWAATLVK